MERELVGSHGEVLVFRDGGAGWTMGATHSFIIIIITFLYHLFLEVGYDIKVYENHLV